MKRLIELFEDESTGRMQTILGSGLLADVREANYVGLDRDAVRMSMGLISLIPPPSTFLECEVGGKSDVELLVELEANGMFVSGWAVEIMSQPAWAPGKKETVQFDRATVYELVREAEPTTDELWARICDVGELCQPQDGPAIRLALKDQPKGDSFWVAMKQITFREGGPDVFSVRRNTDGKPFLDVGWTFPARRWNLDDSVVFRLRKPA